MDPGGRITLRDKTASSSFVLCAVALSSLFNVELLGEGFFEWAKTCVLVSPRVSDMSRLEPETWFKFCLPLTFRPIATGRSESISSF